MPSCEESMGCSAGPWFGHCLGSLAGTWRRRDALGCDILQGCQHKLHVSWHGNKMSINVLGKLYLRYADKLERREIEGIGCLSYASEVSGKPHKIS